MWIKDDQCQIFVQGSSLCCSFLLFPSVTFSPVHTLVGFSLFSRLNLLLVSISANFARLMAPIRSLSATFRSCVVCIVSAWMVSSTKLVSMAWSNKLAQIGPNTYPTIWIYECSNYYLLSDGECSHQKWARVFFGLLGIVCKQSVKFCGIFFMEVEAKNCMQFCKGELRHVL